MLPLHTLFSWWYIQEMSLIRPPDVQPRPTMLQHLQPCTTTVQQVLQPHRREYSACSAFPAHIPPRRQNRVQHLPKSMHTPVPTREMVRGWGGSNYAATSFGIEEASLYTLLDHHHSAVNSSFIVAAGAAHTLHIRCHGANVIPLSSYK